MEDVINLEAAEMAAFGILDWGACDDRFRLRPGADVYFDDNFGQMVPWYLAMGLYELYYLPVPKGDRATQCEFLWTTQGNNFEGHKAEPRVRSLSMGDIAVFNDYTIWYCKSTGWECINPRVQESVRT